MALTICAASDDETMTLLLSARVTVTSPVFWSVTTVAADAATGDSARAPRAMLAEIKNARVDRRPIDPSKPHYPKNLILNPGREASDGCANAAQVQQIPMVSCTSVAFGRLWIAGFRSICDRFGQPEILLLSATASWDYMQCSMRSTRAACGLPRIDKI